MLHKFPTIFTRIPIRLQISSLKLITFILAYAVAAAQISICKPMLIHITPLCVYVRLFTQASVKISTRTLPAFECRRAALILGDTFHNISPAHPPIKPALGSNIAEFSPRAICCLRHQRAESACKSARGACVLLIKPRTLCVHVCVRLFIIISRRRVDATRPARNTHIPSVHTPCAIIILHWRRVCIYICM